MSNLTNDELRETAIYKRFVVIADAMIKKRSLNLYIITSGNDRLIQACGELIKADVAKNFTSSGDKAGAVNPYGYKFCINYQREQSAVYAEESDPADEPAGEIRSAFCHHYNSENRDGRVYMHVIPDASSANESN